MAEQLIVPEEGPDYKTTQSSKRKLKEIAPDSIIIKAKKKQKPTKKAAAEDEHINLDLGLNLAVGRLDNQLLADLITQKIKKADPDLSIVEIEELRIPSNAIYDTSEWQQDRMLQQLPLFLEHFSPGKLRLATASPKNGAPHTIVVTSAGLRAANITRALRIFETPKAAVSKLFAKHIKLKEAIQHVKKTRIGIGVGTPLRIIDLLDAGVLFTDKLERIIIDCSYVDQKKRGILDMRETLRPLLELLTKTALKERYLSSSQQLDLIFF